MKYFYLTILIFLLCILTYSTKMEYNQYGKTMQKVRNIVMKLFENVVVKLILQAIVIILILVTCYIMYSILTQNKDEEKAEDRIVTDKTEKKILFIGNNFTSDNNLPKVFQELSTKAGYNVWVESSTYKNAKITDHVKGTNSVGDNTVKMIESKKWDYVVLQEQYEMLMSEASVLESVESFKELKKKIKTDNTKIILFSTWGSKVDSYYGNLENVTKKTQVGYESIAKDLSATVAPVGIAWLNAYKEKSSVELWEKDKLKDEGYNSILDPKIDGTYLSACVFFNVILKDTSKGILHYAGLSRIDARFLQGIADKTCKENSQKK